VVVSLGDFVFNPPPTRIRTRIKKLMGETPLVGEPEDAHYPLGMDVREIELEGWLVDQIKMKIGTKDLQTQIDELEALQLAGDIVSFSSDVTGTIDVAIVSIQIKLLKGEINRSFRIKLLEFTG